MKSLILLTLLSLNTFAANSAYKVESRYAPSFKVTDVKAQCPKGNGMYSCMAVGTDIHVLATLNSCVDKLYKFQAKVVNDHKRQISFVTIYSNAHTPSSAYSVRCARALTVPKVVRTQDRLYRNIQIINYFMK